MSYLRTRLFHAYARIRRPMTMGVRAAVENEVGHVFMVRHTYVKGWHMPGGGIERGEPALLSLERELLEEGGIILTGQAQLVGLYSNHKSFPNDHVAFYRVPWGAWTQGVATSRGEIAETAWIDPAEPPEGVTHGTRLRFSELYAGNRPTRYWTGETI